MKFLASMFKVTSVIALLLETTAAGAQGTEISPDADAPDASAQPAADAADTTETAAEPAEAKAAPQPEPQAPAIAEAPAGDTTATAEIAAPIAAPESKKSWTDVIHVKGDFRYRLDIENIPDNEDTKVRHRHRIRARLGVSADLPQGFKAHVQLATGSSDPVSTNQTLSEAFSTKPVWIDLAYAGWYPAFAEGLAVEAGKMKNPFVTPGNTELIFDGDLTPEGAALSYSHAFGIVEPFFHGAAFYVQERKTADDAWLLGIQGGVKLTVAEDIVHFILGASYYDHTRIQGNPVYYDTVDSYGNSATLADPADPDSDLLYDNDYNVVEGFFEVGGKIAKFPWAVFTDVIYNAAAEDDNLGWLVGLSFGKCKKPLDFSLGYTYRQLQADATVGAFSDSDFIGGGTGGKGHEWSLGFQLAEPLQLAATYFFNQAPIENSESYNRAQIDLKLKF